MSFGKMMTGEEPIDCWFRIRKQGGFFEFYVSKDQELWYKVAKSIMPAADDFDLVIPVMLPTVSELPEYEPSEEYLEFKKTWPNQAEGDEDDII